MFIKLRRNYVSIEFGRFRKGDKVEVPDELAGVLPSSAEFIDGSAQARAAFDRSRGKPAQGTMKLSAGTEKAKAV